MWHKLEMGIKSETAQELTKRWGKRIVDWVTGALKESNTAF